MQVVKLLVRRGLDRGIQLIEVGCGAHEMRHYRPWLVVSVAGRGLPIDSPAVDRVDVSL